MTLFSQDADQIASLGIEDEALTQTVATLYSPAMKHNGHNFVNDWLQAATIVTREQYKVGSPSAPCASDLLFSCMSKARLTASCEALRCTS